MSVTQQSEAKWFARRFPIGHPRNGMSPVSREGYLVVFGFMGAMMLGGLAFVALALMGQFFAGAAAFVALTALGAGAFIWLAQAKGDHARTVADYRKSHAER